MAAITFALSALLIATGVIGFVATGSHAPTALIPAACGLLFLVFGVLARSPDPKRRMLWMHIAVVAALLLFVGTLKADLDVIRLAKGAALPRPAAIEEKAAMSLFCLLYVLLAVRSFINARRERLAV